MKKWIFLLLIPASIWAQSPNREELSRWKAEAGRVRIIRDNWGIPHIYGKTDADCVFGLLYAQCEDDFGRIELNYVEKLGRMAELKGETEIYNDLMIRMMIDSAAAIADYRRSPDWLRKLLDAWADGINYFLYKNPGQQPALIHRFKPWYPLLWTDGSIGAINTAGISSTELKNFYEGTRDPVVRVKSEEELTTGSNGFAIAPSRSASGHSILYINPHVSFYFRPEVHMISEQGLNSYGAVTWGQFFIYQGFNEHGGWMHTSSAVDVADLYEEKIQKKAGMLYYHYEGVQKPVLQKKIRITYKSGDSLKTKSIVALYTPHGPIMAERAGKWVSLKANNRSMKGLIQSWLRIKTRSFEEYKKVMDLRANTSNNTVYADAEGNIAYWHGNFIPMRDPQWNWARPVDGSIAATEWKGLHTVDQSVHIYNPPNGWIQNCNSTPFTVAGSNSPKKKDYPRYMAPDGENFRGMLAVRVLDQDRAFTLDKIIAAGYDSYLTAFEILIPALTQAFEKARESGDTTFRDLAEAITVLKAWDYHANVHSVATTLAVEWGDGLAKKIFGNEEDSLDQVEKTRRFCSKAQPGELLMPLQATLQKLTRAFGKWQVEWGELNRYQRLSGNPKESFDDQQPSLPVGMVSSTWGCLPSFASRYFPGTQKRYGVFGNSFVCAVEFGPRIKAKSLLTGGESSHPESGHFNDQAEMYANGIFKEVLFYKEDVLKHVERAYYPGE